MNQLEQSNTKLIDAIISKDTTTVGSFIRETLLEKYNSSLKNTTSNNTNSKR